MTLAALAAGLLMGLPSAALAAACGDINNDGNVNSNDSVCLAGCVAGNGVCPSAATLPQCGPGPICTTGNPLDCADIVKDNDFNLPEIQADLNNLSLSLVGIETLYGICTPGRAGATSACPNKIGVCAGDNQTACAVAADCVDQGTTGPCNTGVCGSGGSVTYQSFTIDETTGWPPAPGCTVKLDGTVFVQTNAGAPNTTVLCVEKGTTVEGIKGSPDPAALIFLATDDGGDPDIPDRKAKIDSQGTAAEPIVYTSDQAPGARSRGDWAGVVFNGLSTVNRNFAIGKCFGQGEGLPTPFGGCNENDSSGIATFNRVSYAGLVFTPNNELNLWTMNGLGRRTRFDHIHANVGADDCIEWFGGTINMDHLVASGCGDDGLDFQLGFTGAVQYALYLQNGTTMDNTQRDSRGIEADNSEFGNDALPRSNPVFCNITLVGSKDNGDNGGSDVGAFYRRGVAGKFVNMIVTNHQDAGTELRDRATTQMACDNATTLNSDEPVLQVRNSIFFNNGSGGTEHCKNDVCRNAAGQSGNDACTGAGAPFGCCSGAGAGTCNVTCDNTSECVAGAPDGSFTFCNVGNGLCSSCDWYDQLVASEGVVNADGSNATNPGVGTAYPAVGDLYDGRPAGTLISPATCSDLADGLEDATYVGAFDPAASCNVTNGPCDWLSEPWIDFAIN
jgi:hypothetical protein